MPTSGVTTWTRTADDLIKSAMLELGALSLGEEPTDEEQVEAIVRLNGYLQLLNTEGLMSRDHSGTLTLAAGEVGVSLPDEIHEISAVRLVVSETNHRPLVEWNRAEYYSIPNRAQSGNPMAYYLKKEIGAGELRLWPVPTTDVTLHVDYMRPSEVVTASTQTLDIPQSWYDCVMYNLASRCASMFGVDSLDPNKVARIEQRAAQLHQRLLDDDRPNSYYFEAYHA